jgi:energy-coupling factor transporter ATP-binding protein EcfA2
MDKIKSITLENFKFFYGTKENKETTNTISLNRKNLMVYGENGSGKSSIYWALYTFLQSVYKTDAEVKKYFDSTNNQNLVNRFASNGEKSLVEITFEDENQATSTRHISVTSNTKTGTLVKEAAISSDFINYKYLSRIHDFRNSESIDLFPLFEKDILMYVKFTSEFEAGNSNALDWYNSIKDGLNPRPKMHDQPYKDYIQRLDKFNEELEKYIFKLIESSNGYLSDEFKQPYHIYLNYYGCSYDIFEEGSTTKRNHKFTAPKIKLTIEYIHAKLDEGKRIIERPHTFLNESRLTIIALSLRFAILEEKLISNAPKILVLDDFLMSLDMNKRDVILDVILKGFNDDYQLIILSHDKFFLEFLKHKINRLGKKDNWEYLEMYENRLGDIPIPFVTPAKSHFEKAVLYFKLHEYEIAGNFLRKAAEEFCKKFLPKKLHLSPECTFLDLNGLINQCIKYAEGKGIHSTLFSDLDGHRKFVLNPSSHHSYDIPKFKSEIEKCINTFEKLNQIKFKPIIKSGTKLHFELANGDIYRCDFIPKEDLLLIKLPDEESVVTKAIFDLSLRKNEEVPKLEEESFSIKTKYDKLYSNSDKAKSAIFWDEVILTDTGQTIKTLKTF